MSSVMLGATFLILWFVAPTLFRTFLIWKAPEVYERLQQEKREKAERRRRALTTLLAGLRRTLRKRTLKEGGGKC